MSNGELGQIEIFAGGFAPRDWAYCNGQLLSVAAYAGLFAVIGYTYGGSGDSFAVPDFGSRVAIGAGTGEGLSTIPLGEKGGAESTDLTEAQIPPHRHEIGCTTSVGNKNAPQGTIPAAETIPSVSVWSTGPGDSTMDKNAIQDQGKGYGYDNRKPFLGVHFIIKIS